MEKQEHPLTNATTTKANSVTHMLQLKNHFQRANHNKYTSEIDLTTILEVGTQNQSYPSAPLALQLQVPVPPSVEYNGWIFLACAVL